MYNLNRELEPSCPFLIQIGNEEKNVLLLFLNERNCQLYIIGLMEHIKEILQFESGTGNWELVPSSLFESVTKNIFICIVVIFKRLQLSILHHRLNKTY